MLKHTRRKATKKQHSPKQQRQLGGLDGLTLPGKLVLGYLGIGAAIGVYHAVRDWSVLSKKPAYEFPYWSYLTGGLTDMVAWPYTTVYPWVAITFSAGASVTEPEQKRLSIGPPAPTKTLKKSASGSSTPGYF